MTTENASPAVTGVATPIETPPDLLTVVQSSNLEPATAQGLLDSYRPIFIEAHELLAKAKGAAEAVTDPTRVTEIKAARAIRLQLAAVRVKGDKLREALKQDSLRRSNAIQGVFNVLKYMTEPVEEALKAAEQIAERAEAARKLALKTEREELLKPFGVDPKFYALADMPQPAFDQLLASQRAAHEAQIKAAKEAEEARISKEKADAEERERQRLENERLKREAAEREAALVAERARVAKEQAKAADEARKEREAIEAKARAEREEAERVAAFERKRPETEKAEAEAKAEQARKEAAEAARQEALRQQELREVERQKAEAERLAAEAKAKQEREALEAKAKAEREAREKLEAEREAAQKSEADRIAAEKEAARKAAAAPDKEKLLAFAEAIKAVRVPTLSTDAGIALSTTIRSSHNKFVAWINEKAAQL